MPAMFQRATSVGGFTLVELLVVIAIIALLSSLLLGGISLVKSSAKQVSCSSNQRQLAMAVINYAGEHDGLLPWTNGDVAGTGRGDCLPWWEVVGEYLDDTYHGSSSDNNAYHCPFAKSEVPGITTGGGSIHFGMNANLVRRWQTRWGSTGWDNPPLSISRVSGKTVLMADGACGLSAGAPSFGGSAAATLLTWARAPWPVRGATCYGGSTVFVEDSTNVIAPPIVRHGGRVNITGIDGHVEPVSRTWVVATMKAAFTP